MSSLSWLAFSEAERRQTLDALSGLRDRDTVDELGTGAVRDALSDSMFPGISTIMTRARYLLLVPWTHRWLEEHKISSSRASRRARELEIETIDSLNAAGREHGVIGSQAGATLLRLPSAIYWQSLGTWSIRRFEGGQSAYFRSLDGFYRHQEDETRYARETDDAPDSVLRNWDDELPIPSEFPRVTSLRLSREEAKYLHSRYRLRNSDTVLGWMLDSLKKPVPDSVSYPWELTSVLPALGAPPIPEHLARRVEHAELLSLTTYGGILLYNLSLARMVARGNAEASDRVDLYARALDDWSEEMDHEQERVAVWWRARDEFWQTVQEFTWGRTWATQRPYVEALHEIVLDPKRRRALASDSEAYELIYNREIQLKRGLARLAGGRALDNWGGASGVGRQDYRWRRVREIANDIINGRR